MVIVDFFPHCGGWAVAGQQGDVFGQGEDLLLDAGLDVGKTSAVQIGTADAVEEDQIAAVGGSHAGAIERHRSRGMSGSVQNDQFCFTQTEPGPICQQLCWLWHFQ